jgi:BON domain
MKILTPWSGLLVMAAFGTLTGCSPTVRSSDESRKKDDRDKAQAESVAPAISEQDKSIERNLDAALIQAGLHENVRYSVKDSVVTLTGEVSLQSRRRRVETVAANVPNVLQVINEVRIKGQKVWRKYRNNNN